MDGSFTIVEHTADVGVRATAPTLAGLFVQAAKGLYAALGQLEASQEPATRTIVLAAPDAEGLLHDWLEELRWAFESAGHVYDRFEFERFEPTNLTARCAGHVCDGARSEIGAEIKAVTYHNLNIRRTDEGCEVTVIFDI